MINITIGGKTIREHMARAYCFVIPEHADPLLYTKEISDWFPSLHVLMTAREFTGKKGQLLSTSVVHNGKIIDLIFVGVGKISKTGYPPLEDFKRAIGSGVRQALSLEVPSLALVIPSSYVFNTTADILIEQSAIITLMTAYHFDEFITDKKRKEHHLIDVILCGDIVTDGIQKDTLDRALIIGRAINKARHWVDLPAAMLTPPYFADKTIEIAKNVGLKSTVFEEKDIIKMGMGGLAAVSKGSEIDCRLLILEYTCDIKDAPTVAFVGKGITFDSGGLSLKPAHHMETMKEDMSGAAAVIAAMEAIAMLKPSINVIGVAPMSENLPSGTATKPGDNQKMNQNDAYHW